MRMMLVFWVICLLNVPSLLYSEERGDPQPQDIINPRIWPEKGPVYMVISATPGGTTRPNAIGRGNANARGAKHCVLPDELENQIIPFCNQGDEELKNGMYYNQNGQYIQCASVSNSNQAFNPLNSPQTIPQAIYQIKTCLRIQQAVKETWE